jgi:Ca-activated chloride channel family protein
MVLKKSALPWFFILLGILSSGSCRLLEPGFSVLKGNYAYQQGDYQKALLHYLGDEDKGNHKERILFNIATVYYALGEGLPALELWELAGSTVDEEVLFAAGFNSGVVLYQSGRFLEAYNAFRRALELRPNSLESKKNLELVLERLEAESGSPDSRSASTTPDVSDDARRILQYIKRKEGSGWNPKESETDSEQDW